MSRPVLMLAGTQEARTIAARFDRSDLHLVASLAGVTTDPATYDCETRVGGFGGAGGLAGWLERYGARAVLDATHPFAEQISRNAREAALRSGIPYLCLRRMPWSVESGWQVFDKIEKAVQSVPPSARVLLTTGRRDGEILATRPDVSFFLRSIEAVLDLPANVISVLSRPPYTFEIECKFFHDLGITHLMTKNSGGVRPAKLDAAAMAGIGVFVIAPPPLPDAQVVATVDDALDWLHRLA